jgi:hypothetical protein
VFKSKERNLTTRLNPIGSANLDAFSIKGFHCRRQGIYPGRKPDPAPRKLEIVPVNSLTRSTLVRTTFAQVFRVLQKAGVSVTPSHFYFPVPKLDSLKNKDWRAARVCSAVDLRIPEQVQTLSELNRFNSEWTFAEAKTDLPHEFHFNNGFFERVDVEVAYSLVACTSRNGSLKWEAETPRCCLPQPCVAMPLREVPES